MCKIRLGRFELSSGFISNVSERASPTRGHTLNFTRHWNFLFSPQAEKKKKGYLMLFGYFLLMKIHFVSLPNTYIFDSMSMLLDFENIFCIKK